MTMGGRQTREGRKYGGAVAVGFNLQSPTHLGDAFAHSAQSNPTADSQIDLLLLVGWDSASRVPDFQTQAFVVRRYPDVGGGTLGVSVNIAETFLHNPKYSSLQFRREALKTWRELQVDLDA